MKYLVTILLAAVSCLAQAQSEHFVPKDKWSKALYLSDEFCANKGMEPGETNELLRVWNNLKENAVFTRVVDIRWYFSSPQEAANYLQKNIVELSEKGNEITSPPSIPYASNLRVFKDGKDVIKLNAALGLTSHMYFFLFTEKNYVAKVFISTEKDLPVADVAIFAKEAAARLNTAIK
jgi:hypothetical protein